MTWVVPGGYFNFGQGLGQRTKRGQPEPDGSNAIGARSISRKLSPVSRWYGYATLTA